MLVTLAKSHLFNLEINFRPGAQKSVIRGGGAHVG